LKYASNLWFNFARFREAKCIEVCFAAGKPALITTGAPNGPPLIRLTLIFNVYKLFTFRAN